MQQSPFSGFIINSAGPDPGEKLLQGRAVKGGTGKGAIIIAFIGQAPSFVHLAFDIGLTSLALGVQGIELKVEVMFGGFSRIDRAPKKLLARPIHDLNPGGCRRSRSAEQTACCALPLSPPAAAMA